MKASSITFDPNVMGGKPCIQGMRVTVGTIVGLVASGSTPAEILADYPYLQPEDIMAALSYAACAPKKSTFRLRPNDVLEITSLIFPCAGRSQSARATLPFLIPGPWLGS